MSSGSGVLDRTDAWLLEDPDVVAAEFAAIVEANFGAEPPGTEPDGPSEPSRNGPEPEPTRRVILPHPVGALPASGVAHERSPPPRA
jgi:hypothetical protein